MQTLLIYNWKYHTEWDLIKEKMAEVTFHKEDVYLSHARWTISWELLLNASD